MKHVAFIAALAAGTALGGLSPAFAGQAPYGAARAGYTRHLT